MKILLTGKNGQLGFELQRALAPLGQVFAIDQQECNLASPDALRTLIRKVQPELIINPAAYTVVDRANSPGLLTHDRRSRRVHGRGDLRFTFSAIHCGVSCRVDDQLRLHLTD